MARKFANTVRVEIIGRGIEEFEAGAFAMLEREVLSNYDLEQGRDNWVVSDLTGLLSECIVVNGYNIDYDIIPAIENGDYIVL